MKMNYFLALLAVLGIIALGCAQSAAPDAMMEKDAMAKSDVMEKSENSMEKADIMEKDEAMMEKPSYMGKVLAGTESTKYLDFNKADYGKALKENKKILLYFYSSWCPVCKKEQVDTFAAFNELSDQDLIGFRVNYRDSDTDADEEALAQQFGVGYQHTKIILKDGQRVGKWPDSWDKQRYLEELSKV